MITWDKDANTGTSHFSLCAAWFRGPSTPKWIKPSSTTTEWVKPARKPHAKWRRSGSGGGGGCSGGVIPDVIAVVDAGVEVLGISKAQRPLVNSILCHFQLLAHHAVIWVLSLQQGIW